MDLLAGDAARILGPRWIRSGAEPPTPPREYFALRALDEAQPLTRELLALTDQRIQPYWPEDEATLGPRESEWLCSIPRSSLSRQGTVAELLEATWQAATREVGPPKLMGILNVTPDSFSDGGRFHGRTAAIDRALEMIDQGAHIIDIGGESTRPGSAPVGAEEEWRRVGSVIEHLAAHTSTPISIDTTKATVAEKALGAGAAWVNDISAGTFDPGMLPLVSRSSATYVAMHCLTQPKNMQDSASFGDPVAEVCAWLRGRLAACIDSGLDPERILLDPGIGFGKLLDHNLSLLRRLWELRSLGRPLVLGVSRKSFIGHLHSADGTQGTPEPDPLMRVGGTAAALALGISQGAAVLRVHDVATMGQAALVARAIHKPKEHPQ